MNAAHAHLILNHWPIFGSLFVFLLLVLAAWRKSDDMVWAALVGAVLVALGTIAVYLTGEPAAEVVEHLPGVAERLIEPHEEAALIAMILTELTGVVALAGLILGRRSKHMMRRAGIGTGVLSLVVLGAMAWTANAGGKIHHEETRGNLTTQPAGDQPHVADDDDD